MMYRLPLLALIAVQLLLPPLPNLAKRQSPPPKTYIQISRTFHTASEFQEMTGGRVRLTRTPRLNRGGVTLIGSQAGIVARSADGRLRPYPEKRLLPWPEITVLAAEPPASVWIGTRRGLIRFDEQSGEVKYFAGLRWLPDDRVTGIGFDFRAALRAVWVETEKGMSRLVFAPMTLEEKARHFEERIRARHVRHGFTADSRLQRTGDLTSNRPVSTDNDGLWTAIYVAAEAFRYAVTKSPEAREYAQTGLRALLRLEEITGISGFPARSFIKIGEDDQPADGEWHTTRDGGWRWKGDTSSDEIVGHYFAYPIYYELVADEEEKRQIRGLIDRLTTHILDHDYQLIDLDGKRTRWGWWGPEAIWEDPDETGLRALHLLSHLRVAYHLTQKERYLAAYRELIDKHRYHLLLRNQKINVPGHVNHSDDELAFLSYYPLLRYETDRELLSVYRQSLERSWLIERPERNPLWNFIYAAGSGSSEFDLAAALRTLREIPLDLVSWTVTNSHRHDILLDPWTDRQGRRQALHVLPYDELPIMKWNGNPYRLDGGSGGRSEDDGAYFLLPYWMGRYHGLMAE